MIRVAAAIVMALLIASVHPVQSLAQISQAVSSEWESGEYREFDFWVGVWDVTLRIRQTDNSWPEQVFSKAEIYRILDGKAILELWDQKVEGNRIRGYSLRYFDPAQRQWVLWLNWPGPNRSGTSSLTGSFRHGRGEFFRRSTNQDGQEVISRYTFSDIGPHRLRWDDGFSTDGGRTWRGDWIMEFTRTADRAVLPSTGGQLHTYYTGERCDREEFRDFERLVGNWAGEVHVWDAAGTERTAAVSVVGHKVLDGCAVMSFVEYEVGGRVHKEFVFHTYSTWANAFEEHRLDNRQNSPLLMMYGSKDGGEIVLNARNDGEAIERHRWHFLDTAAVELTVEIPAGDTDWVVDRRMILKKH